MRTNRRAIAAVAGVALVVTISVIAPPARAGTVPVAPTPALAAAQAHNDGGSVTLITGDRVQLSGEVGGKVDLSVQPGPGRDRVTFTTVGRGDDEELLPSDALPLVSAGVLDVRLFQVRRLAREGYDDRHMTSVPLIIAYRGGTPPAAPPASAQPVRALPSIGASALHVSKPSATGFWRSVATGAPSGTGRAALAPGIAHIWLDDQVKVLDADSDAQIGVPAARALGLTGKDVPVAVLDTGIDVTHPDLAGAVAASQDFTGSADGVKDDSGHGTHVASIVAGTGVASGGKYAGVAPQARLLIGKVCGSDGTCEESAVIAGMQWAAAQGARVANLSLGGDASDGTDPMAQAVNALTASSGTLFVCAAGNAFALGTISTPGAADAALAVGSVGRTDVHSSFSSGGPRPGDGAVKPDITAPGEDIVAARAAGTSLGNPVDALYTSASGTSMATPHVTGAAALLAQEHPDWKAADLKAALTSAAAPEADTSPFFQGAGRVDVGRASAATVEEISGSASFGIIHLTSPLPPAATRTVTYRNDAAAPVTLSLSLTAADTDGNAAPAGLLALAASSVTVPAHGTAGTTVTLAPEAATAPGDFAGELTATTPDGVRVETAVGVEALPDTRTLSFTVIGRDGKPAPDNLNQFVEVISATQGILPAVRISGGTGSIEVPPGGPYAIYAVVYTGTPDAFDGTQIYVPFATVAADRTVTLDARPGKRITVRTDRPDSVIRDITADVIAGGIEIQALFGGGLPIYQVPVTAPAGELWFGTAIELLPSLTDSYAYHLAFAARDQIPANPSYRVRDKDLATVRTVYRAQGRPALGSRRTGPLYLPGQNGTFAEYLTLPLPLHRPEFYTATTASPAPLTWSEGIIQRPVDQPQVMGFDGFIATGLGVISYPAGKTTTEEWNRAAFGPDLQHWELGTNLVGRIGDFMIANTYLHAPWDPQHGVDPSLPAEFVTGSTTLTAADGTVVGTSDSPGQMFAQMPPGTGTFTLSTTSTHDVPWSALSTRVDVAWTFTSGTTPADALTFLPLLTVQATGDLDDLNRAPGFAWFPIKLKVLTQRPAKGAAITQVGLDISTDDGKTWAQGWVLGGSGSDWQAVVFNPHATTGTGFVSLRLSATDANGGHVQETIIRAYGLVDH